MMQSTIGRILPTFDAGKAWDQHLSHICEVGKKFSPWVLVLPAALCAWIGTQSESPLWEYTLKVYQETYAPVILAVASVLAFAQWIVKRGFYFRWLALLSGCLFCRELHFQGTGTAIYFAVPLALWYASANYASMKPYVDRRWLVSLFVGAFIIYFFTITVDRAVWKFLPNHAHWRNNVEETLETVGHLMILAVVVGSAFVRDKTPTSAAT